MQSRVTEQAACADEILPFQAGSEVIEEVPWWQKPPVDPGWQPPI
jgi:hypothetical protein